MVNQLISYAQKLGFQDLENRLNVISETMNNGQAELILPLVGEFSAGKTTLINSLTDSKALECASRPTTATIYTIHFSAPNCHAVVHNENGNSLEVDDISSLKNEELQDAVVVDVYDTSEVVPESIVIVDTPGLSSQDIRHKQTLVDFLPNADAILLVSDVNQQITRSLTEFAKTIALSNRPIYLVFTQCDTKSREDVLLAKDYLEKNTELPLSGIVCVSAKSGDIIELKELLGQIQRDKTEILNKVNEFRCREIAKEMGDRIDILLTSATSDETLDNEIREQQCKLNKIKRKINDLTDSISSEITDIQRKISRSFEDKVFEKLDIIVAGQSNDYDSEAKSAINNLASLLLNDYQIQVQKLLSSKAKEDSESEGLTVGNLQGFDLSGIAINGLSYNINLNEAGHEWDSKIATGLKVAGVAAAVLVTAGAAGAAAAGEAGAAGAASAAASGGRALSSAQTMLLVADVADTATDIGSIVANKRNADMMNRMMQRGGEMSDKLGKFNEFDNTTGKHLGQKKGMVESLVGFVTERTMGKPQRRRVIREYIESSLAPTFANELRRVSMEVSTGVSDFIIKAAETETSELSLALEAMKSARQQQNDEFEAKIKELKEIKKQLSEI